MTTTTTTTTTGAGFAAALEVETLKLRRARVVQVATAVTVLAVPLFAMALTRAARSGGDSPLAVKAGAMLTGTGWEAYLGATGQMLSVALLLAVGVVVSWCFGREFTDRTFPSLFALPVGRGAIAGAKLTVLAAWSAAVVAATVAVAAPVGLLAGVGSPGPSDVAQLGGLLVTGGFTAGLGLTFAWPSSAGRGYLSGIAALLGVVVATQVITLTGAGPWFPYAVPGLRTGMGGPDAAQAVPQAALIIPAALTLAVGALTVRWWRGARVT